MTETRSFLRGRLLLTVLALPASLCLAEISARVWVSTRYTPERIEQLTSNLPVRGRFACYPYLPYVLNPRFPGHNSLGFRGDPLEERKPPGVRRIACLGASTTYGGQTETKDSYPAHLEELLAASGEHWEVINAGVLGLVASELLINLQLRVMPLDPDVVVILPSRNEVVAQVYNNFRPDYTHFRRVGFNFTTSNCVHKELFKWSRLFMLACTVRGDRFGWSEEAEHPLYAGLVWENRPTPAQAILNARDPDRMTTMRRSYASMLDLCRSQGVRVLMCMMPERPDKFQLDELDRDPALNVELGALVERDNDVIRDLSNQAGVPVLEAAALNAQPELFDDDCHLSPEGHRVQAQMVYQALQPLISGE